MVGKGRHPILGVWSPDPVLSMVAPIGLAASAGTALIVDLASRANVRGRTLADLVADGPSLDELSPGRGGVAFLSGGPIEAAAATEVIEHLSRHWPALVVRVADSATNFATVPVIPLFPGRLSPVAMPAHGVWQPVGPGVGPPGPGPVLPRLRAGAIRRMLEGRMPRRDKWVATWGRVWEMPWA